VAAEPVKTTLYSLSNAPPAADGDRRDDQRHMTLYRVGSILVEGRRELCLIKNISAGGMMVRLYCPVVDGTPVTVELKSGQPISGKVSWIREQTAGIAFDQPIDVIDILSSAMDGPRPRMPRIETHCHATLREGSNASRVRVCDISQGGVKIESETILPRGIDVVITLPGLYPQPGLACWVDHGFIGVSFNRLLSLGELVSWLQEQRESHQLSR
jgi:hypothetical protein